MPSNASFKGALASRALRPDRSPDSAATKSLADAAVDAFAAPVELPGRGKGTRDRRPGERKVDIPERFGQMIAGILVSQHAVLDPDFRERHLVVGAGFHVARDGLDERRPVADAIGLAHDMDLRTQHHDVGDLETPQQQRDKPQIGGQDVDAERRLGGAAALQPDVMKRDVASGKHRDIDVAVDHQIEPGHGADLRLDRLAQGVPVEEPGGRDQADQRHAEECRNRHPEALHSLGHRQWDILVGLCRC